MSLLDDPKTREAWERGAIVIEVCPVCAGEFYHGSERPGYTHPLAECVGVLVGRIEMMEQVEEGLIAQVLKLEQRLDA